MRTNRFLTFIGACFALAFIALAADQLFRTEVEIKPRRQLTPLTVNSPTGTTADLLQLKIAGTTKFAVPYTGVLGEAYGGTGSADGPTGLAGLGVAGSTLTISADGTSTNTLPVAFDRAPIIVMTPKSLIPAGSNLCYVVSATTTNFIAFGHTNVVYNYIAISTMP